ncbi:putative E3 ubiquitin-protein ligase [Sesbania bispinosa]|nr:putative E3 ubiquitin-protein ligase [Sesbania bispinosa]
MDGEMDLQILMKLDAPTRECENVVVSSEPIVGTPKEEPDKESKGDEAFSLNGNSVLIKLRLENEVAVEEYPSIGSHRFVGGGGTWKMLFWCILCSATKEEVGEMIAGERG